MLGAERPSSHFWNMLILVLAFTAITWVSDHNMRREVERNRDVSNQVAAEARASHAVIENNADMLKYLVNASPGRPYRPPTPTPTPPAATQPAVAP